MDYIVYHPLVQRTVVIVVGLMLITLVFRLLQHSLSLITMTFNENWMEFTVRYVVDYRARRSTRDKISATILDEFAKTDGAIRIAYTSADITITEFSSASEFSLDQKKQ